jgi:hypothetical protein
MGYQHAGYGLRGLGSGDADQQPLSVDTDSDVDACAHDSAAHSCAGDAQVDARAAGTDQHLPCATAHGLLGAAHRDQSRRLSHTDPPADGKRVAGANRGSHPDTRGARGQGHAGRDGHGQR